AALQTHRSRVTSLVGGDGLVLPEDVVDHLSRLRAIGISERGVRTERDGWVLMAARYPERVAVWIEHKRLAFEDPTFRELYLAFDQAFDWPPDDPRVAELAGAWCAFIAGLDPTVREVATAKPAEAGVDDAAVALLKSQQDSTSPTWDRLAELVERKLGRSGIW
ncbi:MAG: hypothetical protein ACRDS9_27695, partial [Pseudonocardiaceae bacterium]